jgi:FtsH-binding integral membrane protein
MSDWEFNGRRVRVDGAAAYEAVEARLAFIKKTYAHLAGAVAAFIAFEALLVTSNVGEDLALKMLRGGRLGWFVVLALFMLVGWVAESWARNYRSPGMQYLGLGLYVVAESLVFLPLLYVAAYWSTPDVIPTAAIITGIVFGGLTGIVFLTKKDFSWLRTALMVAGFGAMGVILASLVFGFSLGVIFCGVMVVIAAGYILYHTSNVLHRYPIGSHVAASLTLFASLALLFWYVLQILLSNRR